MNKNFFSLIVSKNDEEEKLKRNISFKKVCKFDV